MPEKSMRILSSIVAIVLACTLGVAAQVVPAGAPVNPTKAFASFSVSGQLVKDPDKRLSLARKRFYVFAGGVKENTALIERINAAEIVSRDCYYTQINASPCFISWLQEENCETPFCRKVVKDDLTYVKEFEAAYNKGLPLYGRKPNLALDWLVNNLPANLSTGYYQQQKKSIQQILNGQRPVESSMTTAGAAVATFVNIPVTDKVETFLVSNVLPVEVGNKSYVWICEVNSKSKTIPLYSDPAKKSKGCTVTIKDLKKCTAAACEKK
jgi:hypothetical protein